MEIDNLIMAPAQRSSAPARQKHLLWIAAGVIVLLVGVIAGSAMTAKGWLAFGSGGKVPIYLAANHRIDQPLNLNNGFSAVAKAVTPAVVSIDIYGRARAQQVPFSLDPFRDYFNRPDQDDEQPTPRRKNQQPNQPGTRGPQLVIGSGSGVIVSPDGYILTNNHVVDEAEKLQVTLTDRRTFTAKVIGTDPQTDLAVIKIDGTGLPTLPLGDPSKAEVGDIVLAVGNPLGVGQTVTMGIISAKGRSTPTRGSNNLENFLQTDASINRGNSGGALVNLQGEMIGIPSQILSGTGGSIGIGFAIPADMARNVMDQLIRNGKVQRGMLGVKVGDLTPEVAEVLGKKDLRGALISTVTPGEPADLAGVKPGDIVTEFQGQPINDSTQLISLVSQAMPGTTVKFKVWRDREGKEIDLTAKLVERKVGEPATTLAENNRRRESTAAGGALSGVRVEELTPELMKTLDLPSSAHGVVVASVDQESNAASTSLRRGDLIEEVNRQRVSNLAEFNAAIEKAGRKNILLQVRRGKDTTFVLVPAQ